LLDRASCGGDARYADRSAPAPGDTGVWSKPLPLKEFTFQLRVVEQVRAASADVALLQLAPFLALHAGPTPLPRDAVAPADRRERRRVRDRRHEDRAQVIAQRYRLKRASAEPVERSQITLVPSREIPFHLMLCWR
jgi:hypothetical protein